MNKEEDFLRLENVKVHFPVRGGVFRKAIGACKAVDGVSFSLRKGETIGLVGNPDVANPLWPNQSFV